MAFVVRGLLCFLKAVIIVIVILILMTPLFIWCLIVKILAKLLKPNYRGMYDSKSTFFVVKESSIYTNPEMVNTVCLKLKGQELNVEHIKLLVYQKLLNVRRKTDQSLLMYEKLQQHPVHWLGYIFQEWDQDFDINHHIRVVTNSIENVSVDQFIADHIKAPFRENCSPWDLVFVPKFGTKSSNCSLILLRFHHSLCDGFSMMEIVTNSFLSAEHQGLDQNSSPNSLQPELAAGKNWRKKLSKLYRNTIRLPFLFTKTLDIAAQNNMNGIVRNNLHLRKDEIFVASTGRILLKDLNTIKKSLDVPIMAILSTAISNVLHGHFAKNFGRNRGVLEDLHMWHIFPLSKRPDFQLKNRFGSASLQISVPSDSLLMQLESAKQEYNSSKETSIVHVVDHYISQLLFGSLPSALYLKILGESITTLATIIHVSGPSDCQSFLNNQVEDVTFTVSPTTNTGPIFSITTYNGFVEVGVSANSSCSRNSELLQAAFGIEEELRRILEFAKRKNTGEILECYNDNSNSNNEDMTVVWV